MKANKIPAGNTSAKVSEIQKDIGILSDKMNNQILTTSDTLINGTYEGELRITSIEGNSVQDGIPTVTTPVDIENVGDDGSITIKSCGKNLIHSTDLERVISDNMNNNATWEGNILTRYGVDFTINADGSLTINGAVTMTPTVIHFNIGILQKGTYTLSLKGMESIGRTKYVCIRDMYDDGITIAQNTSGSHVTFTLDKSMDLKALIRLIEGDVLDNVTVYPQLEVGSIVTEYEPYKESSNSIVLPLTEPLRGINDVKDEIIKQDGQWGVLRRIGKVIFGDINYTIYYENSTYITCVITHIKLGRPLTSNIISNYAVLNNISSGRTEPADGVMIVNEGYVRFVADSLGFTTTEEYDAWFAENPVTVIYELAEPVFEPFEDQSVFFTLDTFDNITNIVTDQIVECAVIVEYGSSDVSAMAINTSNEITVLKKSVSDGKTLLADAITECGVETVSDATFATMADNIKAINSNLISNVYYIKGASQSDGVGQYSFISPIDGNLFIMGSYSTLGFYVTVNGTQLFKLTGTQNQTSIASRTIPLSKGDSVTLYCQGTYLGILSASVTDESFFANI